MNKSQDLAVMKLRAKIKIEEALKQHYNAWYGKEVQEVGSPKAQAPVVEEEDG